MTEWLDVLAWDAADPLGLARQKFLLPEGVIYLDGNSLGPLSRHAAARVERVTLGEWGEGLIRSWGDAGWMDAPARIGGKIARLIGATADEVIVADSTSVNLFKALAAAVTLRPGRRKILLEGGNFPTDRHVADGLARLLPDRVVQVAQGRHLASAIDQDTAAVMVCHVHYQSGARHDMAMITAMARHAGALTVWDLSHSVGAVAVELDAHGADFAVGCGYKFLNGGPGAPAFIYVARRHQAVAQSPVQGWMGHADPFGFSDVYAPAGGMGRFLSGTPGILGLAALEAGVDGVLSVAADALWAKSARMFDLFAARAALLCPGLEVLTPLAAGARGSHISLRCARASEVMAALIARGVIGDFRPPDILRFGLTPMYTSYGEIWRAVDALAEVLAEIG